MDGQPVRKRSEFQSSHQIQHLHVMCPGGHKHLTLRGGGLPAASARYPEEECNRILSECVNPATVPEGGRLMPPTTFSRSQSLEDILYELREVAYQTTHQEEWEAIVRPWMMRQQIKIRKREIRNYSQNKHGQKSSVASVTSGKVAYHGQKSDTTYLTRAVVSTPPEDDGLAGEVPRTSSSGLVSTPDDSTRHRLIAAPAVHE